MLPCQLGHCNNTQGGINRGHENSFNSRGVDILIDSEIDQLTDPWASWSPLVLLDLWTFPHLFSCGCVCGRPPWKPPGLWSRPAAPPSGRSPRGRCPSGRRWRRSCCSWARPQCPDACGQCSSLWSPEWRRDTSNSYSSGLTACLFLFLNIIIITDIF